MVDGGGGTSFPVQFYDGEREINIGNLRVYPNLEYKPFQHMLSQKIGISPNQISIYLLERKWVPNSSFYQEKRKMPITAKVNFASICRMKDCLFLAVLKRSRKARIRRDKTTMDIDQDLVHPQGLPFYHQINDFNYHPVNRVHDLIYEMGMAIRGGNNNLPNYGFDPNLNVGFDPYPVLGDSYGAQTTMNMSMITSPKAWCEKCLWEKSSWSFHPCVNDVVVTMFQTRAGPIKRPDKRFVV